MATENQELHGSFKIFPESLFSDKHKTVQSFKLFSLSNSLLVQTYTSASNYKRVGIMSGRHLMKAFSVIPSHSYVNYITKAPPFPC
jgi:hypothetical protein